MAVPGPGWSELPRIVGNHAVSMVIGSKGRRARSSYRRQSSLVRWGQYSRIWGPPSVLKRFTTAFSFAVGFAMSSSSSSPLQAHDIVKVTCRACTYDHEYHLRQLLAGVCCVSAHGASLNNADSTS